MNSKAGKTVIALCVLGVFISLVAIYIVRSRSVGAVQQVLTDTGKFRVGSELGMERAGFSGRSMVFVFANPDLFEWQAISACLQAPEVEAEVTAFFTAVLVDERTEPTVEAVLRERDGLQGVVRGLNGAFLGGLPRGFKCSDLVLFLKSVREKSISQPEKSPIYAGLLESTAPLDELLQNGEKARAEKYVEFLKEFEGETSQAVLNAQARLSQ